jgi:hypothetical protein
VNVLKLNLDLDQRAPMARTSSGTAISS